MEIKRDCSWMVLFECCFGLFLPRLACHDQSSRMLGVYLHHTQLKVFTQNRKKLVT